MTFSPTCPSTYSAQFWFCETDGFIDLLKDNSEMVVVFQPEHLIEDPPVEGQPI